MNLGYKESDQSEYNVRREWGWMGKITCADFGIVIGWGRKNIMNEFDVGKDGLRV